MGARVWVRSSAPATHAHDLGTRCRRIAWRYRVLLGRGVRTYAQAKAARLRKVEAS